MITNDQHSKALKVLLKYHAHEIRVHPKEPESTGNNIAQSDEQWLRGTNQSSDKAADKTNCDLQEQTEQDTTPDEQPRYLYRF